MGVDVFLAFYLLGAIVVFGAFSILAYKKQVERGEIKEDN
jgi:hypothetical protein